MAFRHTLLLSLGLHAALGGGVLWRTRAEREAHAPVAAAMWAEQAVAVESVEATPAAEAVTAPEPSEGAALTTPSDPQPVPVVPSDPTVAPRAPAPKPRVAVRSSPASSTSAEAPGSARSPGGNTFGALGLPAGTQHLPTALTRVLPPASHGDPGWATLPLGKVGEIVVELRVNEEGKLGELSYPDSRAAANQPAVLRHMVERALILLKAGTFSLAASNTESGAQRFKIEVELSQTVAREDDPWQHAFEPPGPGRAGKAMFILASGLRMDAKVWVLESH